MPNCNNNHLSSLVTYNLNIVPNRIQNERPVVIGMIIRPHARRTIILRPSLQRPRVKAIDGRTIYTN